MSENFVNKDLCQPNTERSTDEKEKSLIMEKKRYANIDLLKTIAILMVIALHVILYYTNFMDQNGNVNISFFIQYAFRLISEGVPIFILVNGFLMINKEKFDLKLHLKKILKIFLLLIVWSVIRIVGTKLIWRESLNLKDIIKNVLTTDINNKYTGALWFLQNLIALYLVYPVIKNLHDTNKVTYNYLFIVLLIGTMLVNLIYLLENLIKELTGFNGIIMLINYINKFQILTNTNFLIFFMLGGYLFENKEKFNDKKVRIKWIGISIASWIIVVLYGYIMSKLQGKVYSNNYCYGTIFMLFILIGFFAITYKYNDNNKLYNKLITVIGKNSLGIYLIHTLILRIINLFLNPINNIFLRMLEVIGVLGMSLILTLILKKIPKLNKLVEL